MPECALSPEKLSQAAPFGGNWPASAVRCLNSALAALRAPLLVDLGRRLDELGVRKADRRAVGDRQGFRVKTDEMRFEAGGERAGAIEDALGVFRALDDRNDGLERHGNLLDRR